MPDIFEFREFFWCSVYFYILAYFLLPFNTDVDSCSSFVYIFCFCRLSADIILICTHSGLYIVTQYFEVINAQ